MIYMRGQMRDYDSWANNCNDPSWKWNSVLNYFKKHENYYDSDNEYHAVGGPWTVEKQRLKWDVLGVFQKAAIEYGIPMTTDFNRYEIECKRICFVSSYVVCIFRGNNYGVGYFDVNQRKGWRLSAYKAFLKEFVDSKMRSNLTVTTGAPVDKLTFINDHSTTCNGVTAIINNERVHFQANKEVILCAGSIGK